MNLVFFPTKKHSGDFYQSADTGIVNQEALYNNPFYLLPRSQAIYGGLVETLGPYPQYYTT